MTHQTQEQMKKLNSYCKKFLFILAAVCCCMITVAQQPAGNKNGSAATTYPVTRRPDTNKVVDIREKLVQLAMQNPTFEVTDRYVSVAKYQIKRAKGSWLNIISLQGNLNEFSITPPAGVAAGSLLFPRYNVGASIPLDIFSQKSNDIKIAKQNLGIAEAQKNQKFREIKAEVLTKYEDYLMCKFKLEAQNQVTQDAYQVYMQAEKDFSDGFLKQEDYNKAVRLHQDEKIKSLELQRNFNVAKIDMEKLIGVPIESVLGNK
jgi:outer membrane protein TolC